MVAIEQREFDLGEGVVYVVRTIRDLDALPRRLAGLVPPRMRSALDDLARTVLGDNVDVPGFEDWIRASDVPTIEVYDTKAPPRGFGRAAFVRIGEALADLSTPSAFPTVPKMLSRIHAAVGGLWHQFGAHTMLLSPDAIAPVAARGFPRWWLEDAPPLAREAQSFLSFYEDSGTWIGCDRSSSRAVGLGPEIGDVYSTTVEAVLERLFTGLANGKWPRDDQLLGLQTSR